MPRRRKSNPWIIVGIISGTLIFSMLFCCGVGYLFFYKLTAPESYDAETVPYEQARKSFRTQLINTGPSPQGYDPLVRPKGVNELIYTSQHADRLKLKAWVSAPKPGGAKQPAVVFLHGGFAFGEDDWDTVEPFLKAGYAVMIPILRGENGQPGNYTLFYDEVDDILGATEAFAKLPYIDSSRMYVCGHSVGGTLTLLTACTSSRFKAAASYAGAPDVKTWSRGDEELCPFKLSDKNEFRMRSAIAFPNSIKCPIRVYYGDEEFLFKPMSKEFAKKAKAVGKNVEAIEVEGDHGTMLDPAIEQTIKFFQSQ